MDKNSKIYVSGHTGMVGSAILRLLKEKKYSNVVCRTHSELDLCNSLETENFFCKERPKYVFFTAAKMGSIELIKKEPADFLYQNAQMELNVINSALKNDVERLIFIGSSWVYPKDVVQPLKESDILNGKFVGDYEAYALSKVLGMKFCEFVSRQCSKDYFSVISTNIYGAGDNYDPARSHVIPAMICRFYEAKKNGIDEVICWGDGTPVRDFLYSDDLADLCVYLMENGCFGYTAINAASGEEHTIKELTTIIAEQVGYQGKISWDTTKPSGAARLSFDLNVTKKLGWKSKTSLRDGIRLSYKDFLENWSGK